MDKKSIVLKIADALNIFEKSETTIKFESDDVVRIEIISNVFIEFITLANISSAIKFSINPESKKLSPEFLKKLNDLHDMAYALPSNEFVKYHNEEISKRKQNISFCI